MKAWQWLLIGFMPWQVLAVPPMLEQQTILQQGPSITQSRMQSKAEVVLVHHWSTSRWAHLLIQVTRPVPYLYGPLPATRVADAPPFEFYVDLLDTHTPQAPVTKLTESNALLQQVQVFSRNPRIVRLQFVLNDATELQSFAEEKSGQTLIHFKWEQKKHDVVSEKPPGVTRIVLDPGHGGYDPGATAFERYEKDIVLDLAKRIEKLIQPHAHLEVFLTRSSDEFVSLAARAQRSQAWKADLFISLHANAHPSPKVYGMESYFLDQVNSPHVRQIAMRENAMNPEDFDELTEILQDLMSAANLNQSIHLTHSIHHQLWEKRQKFPDPKDLGIKPGPFVVLLNSGVPATLLEIGFVSNPEENELFGDDAYLQALAEGIFAGIQQYAASAKK